MKPKDTENIIDTEEDDSGTFHPVVPYRRPNINPAHLPRLNKMPAMYQFLDGFIIGLEAMERFMRNTRRISRNWFGERRY